MSLTLYFHPLSSFCQKALIALYENETPFERHLLDLGDAAVRARFQQLWPIGKMPVLRDDARDQTVPEATIVIEYLDQHYPGRTELVPRDAGAAWQARLRDRFYDLYVNEPMGKIVVDRLRTEGNHDAYGVERAKAQLTTAYDMIEAQLGPAGVTDAPFSIADCAAAPALYYANLVVPFDRTHPNVAAYLDRLTKRPSVARAFAEAEPYRAMFPKVPA